MIRRIALFAAAGFGLAIAPQTRAQPPAALQFEVASVKPLGHPPGPGGGPWTVNHGRFKADAAWVRAVIALAYDIMAIQVRGGPDWIDRERYDFVAKAESADAGPDQIKAMLQSLLADRFKLIVHRETQQLPVYTLVVGKNGSKMQESKDGRRNYINFTGPGQVVFTEISISGGLINVLSNALGSPVVDKTGLTGFYNFKLEYTDPRFQRPGNASQAPADSPPDIFGAVQEQLGLKLEARKGPVEVLIVDRAERASAN